MQHIFVLPTVPNEVPHKLETKLEDLPLLSFYFLLPLHSLEQVRVLFQQLQYGKVKSHVSQQELPVDIDGRVLAHSVLLRVQFIVVEEERDELVDSLHKGEHSLTVLVGDPALADVS